MIIIFIRFDSVAQLDRASAFMQTTNKSGALLWKIEKIISKGDYDYCIVRNHPNKTKNDYVLHHRVVMENHLSRLLNSNEIVHHINGDKKDNRIDNLQIMINTEHCSLHGLEKGRTMLLLKCPNCKLQFYREKRQTHLVKLSNYTCCSAKCRGKFSSFIQYQGKTQQVELAISENVIKKFNSIDENSEETQSNRGSVETIRQPPEMVKI